jgi:hypothetical protein
MLTQLKQLADLFAVVAGATLAIASFVINESQVSGESPLIGERNRAAEERDSAVRDLSAMQFSLASVLAADVICRADPPPYDCSQEGPRRSAEDYARNSIEVGSLIAIQDVADITAEAPAQLEGRLDLAIANYLRTGISVVATTDALSALRDSPYFGPDTDFAYATAVQAVAEREGRLDDIDDRLQTGPDVIERPDTLSLWLQRGGIFLGGLLLGVGLVVASRRVRFVNPTAFRHRGPPTGGT